MTDHNARQAGLTDGEEMRQGYEEQRRSGINVDWFTWQIAWADAQNAILAAHSADARNGEGVALTDGWLQSGGLLYRLTDERRPQNRDEINVTMANGSREDGDRAARASELLALLAAPAAPAPFREAVEAMVRMLEEGEWAEHVAATTGRNDPLAQRLETAITNLINEARHDTD